MSFKVSFFSNYLNQHQIPFANEMCKLISDNYAFIATDKISQDRLDLGYKDVSHDYSYAINSYESEEKEKRCMQLALESDVVIIGSAPERFITKRIEQGKLTFRYSERMFKRGTWQIFNPINLRGNYLEHTRHRGKQHLHMLCASAYTSVDMRLLCAYPDRMWKWGYFPQFNIYKVDEFFMQKQSDVPKLLWVGRFLDWKRPEKAIKIAKKLKNNGYKFQMDFIGIGEEENKLKRMTEEYSLLDRIYFLGPMSTEMVRKHMEEANIFLFTSNKQEGWGVVLNEAMNSGCAVVANRTIGSVPYLIRDGENGFYYTSDEEFYDRVKNLLDNPELAQRIGENAYQTMMNLWNPKIAAERIIRLSKTLLAGNDPSNLFLDGPCSKA